MTRLWLALLFLLPPIAAATNLTLTWTAPTQNTDTSAIAGPITYNLYGGMQGQALTLLSGMPISTTTNVRSNVNPGTICYAVTAVVNGLESAQTPPVCTTILAPPPNAPSGLTVTMATLGGTAYQVIQNPNALVMLPVGTVPAGTPCDIRNAVLSNGAAFYGVPKTAVTFSGSLKPLEILASCI